MRPILNRNMSMEPTLTASRRNASHAVEVYEPGMAAIGPYFLKNPFILAPMAGVSEQPFRVLAFQMGAALCPTELVSAQGLMRVNARTLRYLRHDHDVERPY